MISGLVSVQELMLYFQEDRYLDFRGTMEYLSMGERKLRTLVSNREIPYFKENGTLKFKKRELDQWMEEFRVHQSQERDIDALVDEVVKEMGE
ncbi:helix-turn-helix domain-containing protein [Acidobacteria bacterium AH-259-D05]|nr:helix-turn-helix domain-containing protein [Acidobacteria bacterium AH-259-D05]